MYSDGLDTWNRIFRYTRIRKIMSKKMCWSQVKQGFSSLFAEILGIYDDYLIIYARLHLEKNHQICQKFGKK